MQERLKELCQANRMRWMSEAQGWVAEADEILTALTGDGFEECKREEARDPHSHARAGVWQGLNRSTGAVASAVWICSDTRGHLVFIDIDGEPLREL